LAATAANEGSRIQDGICISTTMHGICRNVGSSAETTGTPAATRRFVVHALRSLILLYMYIQRSISTRILTFVPGILPAPADLLLAAVAVHLLYICCTAANIRVVVQPDRGTVAPGQVDLTVERDVLLPAANRDPTSAVFRHRGVVEADHGTYRRNTRVINPCHTPDRKLAYNKVEETGFYPNRCRARTRAR